MTVSNQTSKIRYIGNGSTVAFSFPFKIFSAADLEVYRIVQATDVAILQTLTTHYTVAINAHSDGGTVTFVSAPPSTDDVLIKRTLARTQSTDLPAVSNFPEQSIEDALDKGAMIDAEIDEKLGRSLKFAETSEFTGVAFPELVAGKFLKANALGTGLEFSNVVITTLAYSGAFQAGLDANKSASPSTNDIYLATDTRILYVCYSSGTWTQLSDTKNTSLRISKNSHGFVVGDILKHDGTNYVKAQANSEVNARALGIVAVVIDANTFVLNMSGFIEGLSGLTAGSVYYLSAATAGLLTATKPSTAGNYVRPVLMAISTTTGIILHNTASLVGGISGSGVKNLKVTRPGNSTITVAADEITLNDGTRIRNVSVTPDKTTAGPAANGRDQAGAFSNSSWVFVYVIQKSSDGTVAGLMSASATAPTMPTGYDRVALVSAGRIDGSGNFINFVHEGMIYEYSTWQTLTSSVVAAWTSIDLAPFVPSALSTRVGLALSESGTGGESIMFTNDNSVSTSETTDTANVFRTRGGHDNQIVGAMTILTANTLYYMNESGTAFVTGFTVNKL